MRLFNQSIGRTDKFAQKILFRPRWADSFCRGNIVAARESNLAREMKAADVRIDYITVHRTTAQSARSENMYGLLCIVTRFLPSIGRELSRQRLLRRLHL